MKPIICDQAEVIGLLKGRRVELRRPMRGLAARILDLREAVLPDFSEQYVADRDKGYSPFGYPGDRLWVRENWGVLHDDLIEDPREPTLWRADFNAEDLRTEVLPRWRSSVRMPRWRSRLVLEALRLGVDRTRGTDRSGPPDWMWVLEVAVVHGVRP